MFYRFKHEFKLQTGFLLDTPDRDKILYPDPVTGEALKIKKKNLYKTIGHPGIHLYYRANLPGRDSVFKDPLFKEKNSTLSLDENGFLIIKTRDGRKLSHGKTRYLTHLSRNNENFKGFMLKQIENLKHDLDLLLNVHLQAIAPDTPRTIHPDFFYEPCPTAQKPSKAWFIGLTLIIIIACFSLPETNYPIPLGIALSATAFVMLALRFKSIKNFEERINAWTKRKLKFEEKQQKELEDWQKILLNGEDKDTILHLALNSFDWPRETTISFEFKNHGKELHLDMDLPNWTELPYHNWQMGGDGVSLQKNKPDLTECNKKYVRHIHSLAYLAAAASFWAMPDLETLYLSAYCENYQTQGTSSTKVEGSNLPDEHLQVTGKPSFLLSLKIEKELWQQQHFEKLEKLDPVEALNIFELRRDLNNKTMILYPIEPF